MCVKQSAQVICRELRLIAKPHQHHPIRASCPQPANDRGLLPFGETRIEHEHYIRASKRGLYFAGLMPCHHDDTSRDRSVVLHHMANHGHTIHWQKQLVPRSHAL